MNNRKNKKIEILTDFDGTLTEIPGGDLVFTDFFQNLQLEKDADYLSQLFPLADLVAMMKEEFSEYEQENSARDPRRISQAAVSFLKNMLKNQDVGIYIITRNNPEYVSAMLAYERFSSEEIEQLPIVNANKYTAASQYMMDKTPQVVYVFDDNLSDAKDMAAGAKTQTCGEIVMVSEAPGHFAWTTYEQDILQKLKGFSISNRISSSSSTLFQQQVSKEVPTDTNIFTSPGLK